MSHTSKPELRVIDGGTMDKQKAQALAHALEQIDNCLLYTSDAADE